MPIANEVGGLYPIEDGLPIGELDIVVYPRNPQNAKYKHKIINILNSNIDALSYVLLYPYGERSWSVDLEHVGPRRTNTRIRVSLREYVVYRLSVRYILELLHSATKLFL